MDIQTQDGLYRITADDYCWTLCRVKVRGPKSKHTGAAYETDHTYHTRFDTLADKLARMAVKDCGTNEITDALRRIESALSSLVAPYRHPTEEAA